MFFFSFTVCENLPLYHFALLPTGKFCMKLNRKKFWPDLKQATSKSVSFVAIITTFKIYSQDDSQRNGAD